MRVVVYPSLVQGAGAPAALVESIGLASRRAEVDALAKRLDIDPDRRLTEMSSGM